MQRARARRMAHVRTVTIETLKAKAAAEDEMGAALSSRAEWTSASEKGGKLDFSKANERLLLEILQYVETLCKDHPREASVTFKRPFVWKTSLSLTAFDGMKDGGNYIFT